MGESTWPHAGQTPNWERRKILCETRNHQQQLQVAEDKELHDRIDRDLKDRPDITYTRVLAPANLE